MKILYLPSNPKYRAFTERALEFVEQVYRDEVPTDLEFVAYSVADRRDVKEIDKKLEVRIADSHYDATKARAVVVVCDGTFINPFLKGSAFSRAISLLEDEMARKRNPLANFVATAHEMFTRAIKRFPAEVHNSNPSRYRVLYSNQPVRELPL
jgi:hypothetical protein